MSPKGIGIDIIDIQRFASFKKDSKSLFLLNNFSKNELDYCFSYKDFKQHLAGTFAAKEAVFKALGQNILLRSITIKRKSDGQPVVYVRGKRMMRVCISISHTSKIAVAIAIRN